MKNKKGFTLLEVTLAGTVLSIALLALASFMDFVNISSQQAKQKDAVASFRQNLVSVLQDKRAWYQTLATANTDNPNLSCLLDNSCTTTSGGPFLAKDAVGTIFYNPMLESNTGGFDTNGRPCSGFDATTGNPQCPYRYTLSWSPVCPTSGLCIDPGMKVTGTFVGSPAAAIVKNIEQMNFSIYVNSEPKENPVALADEFYTMQNSPVANFPLISNDYFPLGANALQISAVGAAFSGAAVAIDAGNKTITYTPPASFYGLDYFEYTASDALGNSSTGKVWVRVMTPFTWTGDAGDGLWSTASNWCGSVAVDHSRCIGSGAAPSATSAVVFDDTCTRSFCNATNTAAITAASIRLSKLGKVGYPGVFTQAGAISIPYVASPTAIGFTQESGQFVGANFNITSDAPFRITGGTFTAPSLLTLRHEFEKSGTAVFNNAGGSVHYSPKYSLNTNFIAQGVTFNNLRLGGAAGTTIFTDNISVTGTLDFTPSNTPGLREYNNGIINARGDILFDRPGYIGTTDIRVSGGGNQTISSNQPMTFNGGIIPDFEIASAGGTVTMSGSLKFAADVIYTSGTVDLSAASIEFRPKYSLNATINLGPLELQNARLSGAAGTTTIVNKIVVNGDLIVAGSTGWPEGAGCRTYNTGDVEIKGNVTYSRGCWENIGNYKLKLIGNSNQSFTSTVDFESNHPTWGIGAIGKLEIASTGGTVSLIGALDLNSDFIYTSGNVNATATTLRLKGAYSSTATIQPGPIRFPSVMIAGGAGTTNIVGTLYSLGTLSGKCGGVGSPGCRTYNGGTIKTEGDLNFTNNVAINSDLELLGGNSQVVALVDNQFKKNVTVNKTGTLSFAVPVVVNNFNQDFTITAGSVNTGGNELKVKRFLTLAAGTTLNLGGGIYSYGTLVNNGTIIP